MKYAPIITTAAIIAINIILSIRGHIAFEGMYDL